MIWLLRIHSEQVLEGSRLAGGAKVNNMMTASSSLYLTALQTNNKRSVREIQENKVLEILDDDDDMHNFLFASCMQHL